MNIAPAEKIVQALGERGSLSASRLMELGVSKSTLYRALGRLEREGKVERLSLIPPGEKGGRPRSLYALSQRNQVIPRGEVFPTDGVMAKKGGEVPIGEGIELDPGERLREARRRRFQELRKRGT